MLIGYVILRWGPRHPRFFFWRPLPRGDAHRLNAAQCLTAIFKDPLPSHPLPGSFLLLFTSAEEGNFPHGSVIKNLPANAGDTGDVASIPVSGIPQRKKWQPTPVLLPGEFHGQRSLLGYGPRDRKELGDDFETEHRRTEIKRVLTFSKGGNNLSLVL